MPIIDPELQGEAQAYVFNTENVGELYTNLQILAIVNQDIAFSNSHGKERDLIRRWEEDDRLYTFQVRQSFWEGTQIPRSSLGVPLVLEHVNALNAPVMDVLFEERFEPVPYPGTPTMFTRALTEILSAQMDAAGVETQTRRGSHSGLLRGTGVWKCYWDVKNGYRCPKFVKVERKHLRVDPSCRVPDIREAAWKAHIFNLSIRDIDKLRHVKGYKNIPPMEILKKLAVEDSEEPPRDQIDTAGTASKNLDFSEFPREQQSSVDPALHKLQIIEYCTDEYVWTVLQGKVLIREVSNKGNKEVLYLSSFFVEQEGQFDGIGIGALNGNEQRLIQGLLNLMVDYAALSALGFFKRRKGSSIFAQQIRVSPGKVVDVDDMNDMDAVKLPGIDSNVFNMITEAEQRAARRSGANEIAVQGATPDSTGGLGRTAFGMNMLAQAASARIRDYARNIESQVLIPFLEWLCLTNPTKLDRRFVETVLSPELLEAYDKNSEKMLEYGQKFKFKMYGAIKMKRRLAMLQSVPVLVEYFQQPTVQENIRASGQVFEHNELVWMMMDATGWPNKEQLIRKMTDEEYAQYLSENDLVKEMTLYRLKSQVDGKQKIAEIDAKNSGIMARDAFQMLLEEGRLNEESKKAMEFMSGQKAANAELDAEMEEMNATGSTGNPGTGQEL